MNILHLTASPRGSQAESHTLSTYVVDWLRVRDPSATITFRPLGLEQLEHTDADYANTLGGTGTGDLTRGSLARSDRLIEELEAADIIVLGTPMHNLTVPSALKTWIDHIVRMHRTMRPSPQGKVGTLADRPVYIAITSGGYRTGPKARQPDFIEPYLRAVFPMIGMHSITVFTQEGTAAGPERPVQSRLEAWAAVDQHFSTAAKAA